MGEGDRWIPVARWKAWQSLQERGLRYGDRCRRGGPNRKDSNA